MKKSLLAAVAAVLAAAGCHAPPRTVDVRADVSALVPTPVVVKVSLRVDQ